MERFVQDEEEEQLVDLFDQELEYSTDRIERPVQKRQRLDLSALEHHYLSQLPTADMYERSYMHKETVTQSKSRLSLT